MPSSTVENYLKQIYLERQQQADGGDGLVAMGRLAAAMGVVPGTATSMVKALSDSGLVSYEPRGGVKLTRGGEQLALHVLRRHRLVELFLVRVLGLDWSEVHDEAEELEHAISDKVLERIDALLDRPSTDPHGDPIPSAKGKLADDASVTLAECEARRTVRVTRVLDQNPAFLQFADRAGLTPGTKIFVELHDTHAAAITVKPDRKPQITLGIQAAASILVQRSS